MGMQKRKSSFGIIIAAIACVSIASAPSKALAGMIPSSFVGPHEYDYPGIAEKENAKLYSQVSELLEQHDKAFSAQDLKGDKAGGHSQRDCRRQSGGSKGQQGKVQSHVPGIIVHRQWYEATDIGNPGIRFRLT